MSEKRVEQVEGAGASVPMTDISNIDVPEGTDELSRSTRRAWRDRLNSASTRKMALGVLATLVGGSFWGGRGKAHERDGDLDGGQQLIGVGGELDGALGALIALLGIVLQHSALSRGESHLGHGEVAVDKRQDERGNKGDGYVHREFLEPPRFGTLGRKRRWRIGQLRPTAVWMPRA